MAEVCFSEFRHPACVTEIYAKATGITVIDPMENFKVRLCQSVTGVFRGSSFLLYSLTLVQRGTRRCGCLNNMLDRKLD